MNAFKNNFNLLCLKDGEQNALGGPGRLVVVVARSQRRVQHERRRAKLVVRHLPQDSIVSKNSSNLNSSLAHGSKRCRVTWQVKVCTGDQHVFEEKGRVNLFKG